MARKTNKTAHVLNLITNSPKENDDIVLDNESSSNDSEIIKDAEILADAVVPIINESKNISAPNKKPEASKSASPNSPVVEILYNEHDPLSDLIKNVLSETAAEVKVENIKNTTSEPPKSAPISAAIIEEPKKVEDAKPFDFSLEFDEEGNEIEHVEPIVDSAPEAQPNTNSDVSPASEEIINSETSNESSSGAKNGSISNNCDCNSTQLLEQLEKAQNMHFHDRKDLNSMVDLDFKYVNVYEIIVQDKLLDYMKKFDVCMCDRCIVDTFALAVTALPTKIVVVDKNEVFPLISFFEVKNTAIISTALIKACMIVKDNPNHNK